MVVGHYLDDRPSYRLISLTTDFPFGNMHGTSRLRDLLAQDIYDFLAKAAAVWMEKSHFAPNGINETIDSCIHIVVYIYI